MIYFFHFNKNYIKVIIKKKNIIILKNVMLKNFIIKKNFNIFYLIYLTNFI